MSLSCDEPQMSHPRSTITGVLTLYDMTHCFFCISIELDDAQRKMAKGEKKQLFGIDTRKRLFLPDHYKYKGWCRLLAPEVHLQQ